jgi:hypothetical protein
MSKVMKCNGQYVANDPCYPVCSLPDGSGCDYSGVFGGGGSIGGPTDNYTITTGNAVTGNTSTRSVVSPMDPYQNINPNKLNSFNGVGFDGSNRDMMDNDGGPTDLWFNAEGGMPIQYNRAGHSNASGGNQFLPRYPHKTSNRMLDTEEDITNFRTSARTDVVVPGWKGGRTTDTDPTDDVGHYRASGCGKGFCGPTGGTGKPPVERGSTRLSNPDDWDEPHMMSGKGGRVESSNYRGRDWRPLMFGV